MSGWNYFNYFTEIEEYFWKKRGANLLVSPLDWAIMEAWQQAGVPLEAALKGIDRAFESHARSRRGSRPMKSLAYCTDAVLEAAEEAQEAATGGSRSSRPQIAEPFSRDALRTHFEKNLRQLEQVSADVTKSQPEIAARINESVQSLKRCSEILDSPATLDLEDLERRLTLLDDRIQAVLLQQAGDELMLRLRREMDAQLAVYRRKMRGEQIALVERQYFHKRLLEEFRLPRLSLFYLQH